MDFSVMLQTVRGFVKRMVKGQKPYNVLLGLCIV